MFRLLLRRAAGIVLSTLIAAQISAPAHADSRVLYQRKSWEVRVATMDDGGLICLARVRPSNGTTFAIYANGVDPVRLQFYATSWQFSGGSADVVARVDGRPRWNLNNAQLYKNSVFFNLPDSSASTRFLREIQAGNVLRLYTRGGRRMASWTLAGSRASINALVKCVNLL